MRLYGGREELMISKTARFTVGIVTLSSIGAFVSSTGFAQHEPGQYASGSPEGQQAQDTTLTGVWTLNKDLSDDPAQTMAATHGERPGRSGHGPWRHGGRGRGDPGQMQAMHAQMHPARLTITQASGSITFTDGEGRSQTLTTNNKKQKLPLHNRTVEVRTKWDDGRLVKETSLGDGMKLTETYSVVSEPRQLHVMVKLEGSHLPRPVNLRRVYDAESRR
jgi:hypothetical protein